MATFIYVDCYIKYSFSSTILTNILAAFFPLSLLPIRFIEMVCISYMPNGRYFIHTKMLHPCYTFSRVCSRLFFISCATCVLCLSICVQCFHFSVFSIETSFTLQIVLTRFLRLSSPLIRFSSVSFNWKWKNTASSQWMQWELETFSRRAFSPNILRMKACCMHKITRIEHTYCWIGKHKSCKIFISFSLEQSVWSTFMYHKLCVSVCFSFSCASLSK